MHMKISDVVMYVFVSKYTYGTYIFGALYFCT